MIGMSLLWVTNPLYTDGNSNPILHKTILLSIVKFEKEVQVILNIFYLHTSYKYIQICY